MLTDKNGHFYLTTLEYVFHGTNSLITQCPSCGLRLIIRYDNLMNNVTSLGLIIGISAFIGYHLGSNREWLKQITRKLLKFFDLQQSEPNDVNLNIIKIFRTKPDCLSKTSENTNDSAVDFYLSDYEDFDEQLYEMLNYNKYYDDMFAVDRMEQQPNYQNIHSKTVDKIDQVLHQIDDIKKSIVEIDDELYQVTGSKYANFNPDFFTLTDYVMDEFEESQLSPRKIGNHKRSNNSKQNRKRNNTNKNERTTDDQQFCEEPCKLSRMSFASVDIDQLEWDESECDFYFRYPNADANIDFTQKEDKVFVEKLSSAALSQNTETPMTDEQKLKNMHELLEEAKRLGLLNNIIDACLNPSTSVSIRKASTLTSDNEEEEF